MPRTVIPPTNTVLPPLGVVTAISPVVYTRDCTRVAFTLVQAGANDVSHVYLEVQDHPTAAWVRLALDWGPVKAATPVGGTYTDPMPYAVRLWASSLLGTTATASLTAE